MVIFHIFVDGPAVHVSLLVSHAQILLLHLLYVKLTLHAHGVIQHVQMQYVEIKLLILIVYNLKDVLTPQLENAKHFLNVVIILQLNVLE